VLKNILLGSSPMKKEELAKKIEELRKELAVLKT
jgi:ribosomal protein L29